MHTLSLTGEQRFAYTDRCENYFSLHATSSLLSDGFVSLDSVLLHDIGIVCDNTVFSRFKNSDTTMHPHTVSFRFCDISSMPIEVSVSVLYESASLYARLNQTIMPHATFASLYMLFEADKEKRIETLGNEGMAIPANDGTYVYRFDAVTGIAAVIACAEPFMVRLPSTKEYNQLKSIHDKKVLAAVCIEPLIAVDTDCAGSSSVAIQSEWYIVFDTPKSSTDVARTNPLESSFDRACRLVSEQAIKKHTSTVDTFVDSLKFEMTHDDKTVQNMFTSSLLWAAYSGWSLVTGTQDRGIWAGLPWFRDNWGRDTFIALSGILLATGCFAEAKSVIKSFARYQECDTDSVNYGRIPNRYRGDDDVIFNTADGTLWFIREIWEYAQYTGDIAFIKELFPLIKIALEADLSLRTDDAFFLLHGDADTWMDARLNGKQPFSPRGDKAVDIQALWYTALCIGVRCAKIAGDVSCVSHWQEAADTLKKSMRRFFWNSRQRKMADCILPCIPEDARADARQSSENFTFVPLSKHFDEKEHVCDYSVRPNQLFAIQVPDIIDESIFDDEVEECIVQNTVNELLVPYGVLSLSPRDPYFHPYHDGCSSYHKDPAYHNGTIWGWNAGAMISSLCRYGKHDFAWQLTKELARQIIEEGCAGSMSENLDAVQNKHGKIVCSGTWSQAWSVSEFVRNTFQDYVGCKPRLLENTIHFSPRIPQEWKEGVAECVIGGESFEGASADLAHFCIKWKHDGDCISYTLSHTLKKNVHMQFDCAAHDGVFGCTFDIAEGTTRTIVCTEKNGSICLDGTAMQVAFVRRLSLATDKLQFARYENPASYKAVRKKNYLTKKVIEGSYAVKRYN